MSHRYSGFDHGFGRAGAFFGSPARTCIFGISLWFGPAVYSYGFGRKDERGRETQRVRLK
jgi:hypothetical protein